MKTLKMEEIIKLPLPSTAKLVYILKWGKDEP